MNENQEKEIIISDVQFSSYGPKIKDERGLVYNISQYKKGTTQETVAYSVLSKLPNYGAGLKKRIAFVEIGNSQGGTSRYVNNITDITGQPNVLTPPQRAINNTTVTNKTDAEEAKWNAISTGKVRYGVACEFIKLGAELNPVTVNKINQWTDYIMTGQLFKSAPEDTKPINQGSVLPAFATFTPAELGEEVRNDDDEEIRVDQIPF